jgi:hypothetical protein
VPHNADRIVAQLAPMVPATLRTGLILVRGDSLSKKPNQEIHMAANKNAVPEFVVPDLGKRFVDMTGSEKVTWLGKVAVMLLTGGFAFPNIFVE